jgi:hypothetical protein
MIGQLARRRPSAAMLVAIVALVVAASGTAVAASKLVRGDSLIKKNSLSGNRLRNRSVTGAKLKLSSLGTVPSARHATSADSATSATSATNATNATNASNATTAGSAPIAKLTYVTTTVSVPGDSSLTTGTAICPAGTDATGGGGRIDDSSGGTLLGSYPAGKTGWSADFTDFSQAATGTIYAICAPAASTAP